MYNVTFFRHEVLFLTIYYKDYQKRGRFTLNFLNQFNLIPKNFIVANIVDTLKDDPEQGIDKVYKLATDYVTDESVIQSINDVKSYYDTHPSVKLLLKNICYNTSKSVLNHTIQNICVHTMLDGQGKREKAQAKHHVVIPPILSARITTQNSRLMHTTLSNYLPEGKELGIHVYLLNGDDELYTSAYLSLYKKHSDIQFLLISKPEAILTLSVDQLSKMSNVTPVIVSTSETLTPTLQQAFSHLKKANLFYGAASDLTALSIQTLVSSTTTVQMIRQGARFHFWITSPQQPLTSDQQQYVKQCANQIRQTKPYLPILIEKTSQDNYALSLDLSDKPFTYEVIQLRSHLLQDTLAQYLIKQQKTR